MRSRRAGGRPMRPLAELDARDVRAVLVDIDDTLSTQGRLTAQAYGALERLQLSGLLVVPVTGRPAGWCDHIARMWPVDAVVGENGAFYFFYSGNRLHKRFFDDLQAGQKSAHAWTPSLRTSSPRYRGARWLPTSLTGRPISRSITARTCRRCRSRQRAASRS